MIDIKYKQASSSNKPLEVDDKISRDYIYLRKNIREENGRYFYEEACIPKRLYELYNIRKSINELTDTSKVLSDADLIKKIINIIQE